MPARPRNLSRPEVYSDSCQLRGLYFGEKTLETGIPVSGFVFFPAGEYVGVRAVVVEKTSKQVQDVFGPMVPRA